MATTSSAVTVDAAGNLHAAGAVHVRHKPYDACSPWSANSTGMSFTCDDTTLPDAAFPYVIDPTFNTGPSSYDSTYFSIYDEGCCSGNESTEGTNWNAHFNISSIPSNAVVQSVSLGPPSYAWYEGINSQAAPSCSYSGSSWTTNLGGQIPGASTLTLTMNFQMGWWSNNLQYECTANIYYAQNINLGITYRSPEVMTVPNMTGPMSGNTGIPTTFNIPGGVQYSSWGNQESFYFNWGDMNASGMGDFLRVPRLLTETTPILFRMNGWWTGN
jgi:hypothetical protein